MRYWFLLLTLTPLYATIIVQKNGDVISGKIISDTPEKFVFQSPYGVLQISKSNVKKLILDEKTIELKSIADGAKTVKARLVNQENNTATYVTEDGRTIKKEESPETAAVPSPAAPAPVTAPLLRDKILLAFQGSFGFANYQQPQDTTPNGFNQPMKAGTWGFEAQGIYGLSRFFGVGALASIKLATGTTTTTDQPPPPQQLLTYNTTTTNTAVMMGGVGVVSLLGNLGTVKNSHDLRVEFAFAYSLHWAAMDLSFGSSRPPNFPTSLSAQGKASAPAIQGGLVYAYSISESLRLKLGGYYTRYMYTSIYAPPLKPETTSLGQFRTDFEKSLQQGTQNPAVISFAVGLEFSF